MQDGATLLIALFAGMWGSFGMALKFTETLNERRDVVLGTRTSHANMTPENRRQVMVADWIPLWLAGLGYFVVAFVFFLALPDVGGAQVSPAPDALPIWQFLNLSPLHAVSYLTALVALIALITFAWGGVVDLRIMRESIRGKEIIADSADAETGNGQPGMDTDTVARSE